MFLIEKSKYEQIIFGHAYWFLWKTNTFSAFLKEGTQTALSVMNEILYTAEQLSQVLTPNSHLRSKLQLLSILHILERNVCFYFSFKLHLSLFLWLLLTVAFFVAKI